MKKVTLILSFLMMTLVVSNINAQDKPEKGSFGTEIQFNPFDQDGKTFSLEGLKLRYFLTDKDVLRLKLRLSGASNKFSLDEKVNENVTNTSDFKTRTGLWGLNVGYERHFAVAHRVSVYVGGELGFSHHFAHTNISSGNDGDKSIEGIISNGAITKLEDDGKPESDDNLLNKVNDRAYFGFNAAAIAGLDFYVYKGLYLGAELGFKIESRNSLDMKYQYHHNIGNGGQSNIQEFKSNDSARETSFGFYVDPVIRLGWTF